MVQRGLGGRARTVKGAVGPRGEQRRVVRDRELDEWSSEEVVVDGAKVESVFAGGCRMLAVDGEDGAVVGLDLVEDDVGDAVGRTVTCQLQARLLSKICRESITGIGGVRWI